MAISDDVKLRVYNDALRHLGARRLGSLAENREPRRVLDDAWASDDAPRLLLGDGDWNFATRTVKADYSPSVTPQFGFARAFDKPADFVRLTSMGGDERIVSPFTNRQYQDEGDFWFSDHDVIYVRYVSDGTDYGLDSGKWTPGFRRYLAAWLAWDCAERLTGSTTMKAQMDRVVKNERYSALSRDAMNEGVKFPPQGGWARARGASQYSR